MNSNRKIIEQLKKKFNLPIKVCNKCEGRGEITIFCGHYVEEDCQECKGKGYNKNET